MAKKKSKGILSRLFGHDTKEAGVAFQMALQQDKYSWLKGKTALNYDRGSMSGDYDAMMEDSIIQSALEMYVDDSLQYSREQGAELWITGTNKKLVNTATDLLESLELDEIRDWAMWTGQYGNYYTHVFGEDGKGVTMVVGAVHPKDVRRLEWNGYLQGFRVRGEKEMLKPWEMIHFRLLGGSGRKINTQEAKKADNGKVVYNTAKYGTSILEPARKVYKQLTLVEDHIIIGRLTRASLTYLISLMTGNLDVDKAMEYVSLIEETLKEKIAMSSTKMESYTGYRRDGDVAVIPVSGDKGSLQVNELGGNPNVAGVKDLDHLMARMSNALKIPLPILGWVGNMPGSLGEGPIRELAKRYSRTVKRLQRGVISGMMNILAIHFAYMGIDITGEDLQIELLEPSGAEENERREAINSSMNTSQKLWDFFTSVDIAKDIDSHKFASKVLGELTSMGFNLDDIMLDTKSKKGVVPDPEEKKEKHRRKLNTTITHFDEIAELIGEKASSNRLSE